MRNAAIIVALAFLVSAAVASVVPEEQAGNVTEVHAPENITVTKPVEPEPVKTGVEEKKETEVNHLKSFETDTKKTHSKAKFFKSKEVKAKVNKTRSKKITKSEKDHDEAPRLKRGIIMPGFKCPTQVIVQGDHKICAPEGYNQFPMGLGSP